MAAACLARLGTNFKIIDQRLPGETAGHADGIQPRTVEIWDSLGMGEELRRVGRQVYRTVTYEGTDDKSGIKKSGDVRNVSVDGARYPFEVILPPEETERIMRETLKKYDVVVQQPIVPRSLTLSDPGASKEAVYPVEVVCCHLDVTRLLEHPVLPNARSELARDSEYVQSVEIIRARYVIGCDGAHSWVRKHCGIRMEGTQPGLTWGVMDFTPITDFPTRFAKNIVQSPHSGDFGLVPQPGSSARIYALFQDDHLNKEGSTSDFSSSMSSLITEGFLPYEMQVTDVTWCSRYTVTQRVASSYTHGDRIIIAGDACHVHSPNAGQGANVSMTDAFNLAWKLAYILRGISHAALLKTYEAERRPHSIELMDLDMELQKLHHPDADISFNPDEYLRIIQRQNMFTSGIGLTYTSRLTLRDFQSVAPGLLIGQRFPPAEILRHCDWNPCNLHDLILYTLPFKLVVFSGSIAQAESRSRFLKFVEAVAEMRNGAWQDRIEMSAVLYAKKNEIPEDLELPRSLPDTRIYVDDKLSIAPPEPCGEIHRLFGIQPEVGAAAFVRPDGHIAMLLPVYADAASRIEDYLDSL